MDWFKMQVVWGASIERFSDAEAGRFVKALYAYVRDGAEYAGGSGREDPIIWQALETLRKDVEAFKKAEANQKAKEEELRQKRSEAAKKRWSMQNDANGCTCMQNDALADSCTICNAFASQNKNKNVIKETTLKSSKEKRGRFSPPSLEEVTAYCKERQNSIDPQTFIDFYAAKGWKVGNTPMKDWKACVRTWEQRDRNGSSSQNHPRLLRSQDYEQREYHEEELVETLGVDNLFKAGAS